MYPFVLLQIPFRCKTLITYAALEFAFLCMQHHVCLQAGFQILFIANHTFDGILFEYAELIGMGQSYVTGQTVFVHESLPTIRTTFRLFIMRFTVPGYFRFRMEYFTTRTNEIFLLRSDF